MPLANWNVPFELTSALYSSTRLPINSPFAFPAGTGQLNLRHDGCSINTVVRSTKNPVPQADGDILHRRFTTGTQMNLAIQFWDNRLGEVACGELLQSMLDTTLGYLFALINAGDNEGRISWTPEGENARMLDDIRLLSYMTGAQPAEGGQFELGVTLDCALPYVEDLTQLAPTLPGTVVNAGNRPTYPVWRIDGPFTTMTLTNSTTTESFSYNNGQPGAPTIGSGDILEIDTFLNSVTKIETGPVLTNAFAGMVLPSSEFFLIDPGSPSIALSGASSGTGLINSAWTP